MKPNIKLSRDCFIIVGLGLAMVVPFTHFAPNAPVWYQLSQAVLGALGANFIPIIIGLVIVIKGRGLKRTLKVAVITTVMMSLFIAYILYRTSSHLENLPHQNLEIKISQEVLQSDPYPHLRKFLPANGSSQ